MKTFKIFLYSVILSIPLFIFYTSGVFALDTSIEKINSYNVDIRINTDGTINVSEDIEYFFPDDRHGIFRKIPYRLNDEAGKTLAMKLSNYSVTDPQGRSIKYRVSKENGDIVLKIGDPNKTVTGNITYHVEYKVSGALGYFAEYDEIYWDAIGTDWEIPIERSSVQVILPNNFTEDEIQNSCYTGAYGSQETACTFRYDQITKTVSYTLTKPLGPGEGFTVATGFPKGNVTILMPEEEKPGVGQILLWIFLGLAAIAWYLVLPIIFIARYISYRKENQNARVVAAWFDPPKDKNNKFLSPAETSVLLDKTVDHKDITATIIQMAQKGYWKIVSKPKSGIFGKDDYELHFLKDSAEGLSNFEEYLFINIHSKSNNNVVSINELSKNRAFGTSLLTFQEKVTQGLIMKGLFKENPQKTHTLFMVLFGLAFPTLNIFMIIAAYLASQTAKRTQLGIEKYGEAKSLKKFLVSQDEKLDFQAQNQMFFEKLLPYATAFGVEDVWIKRFSDIKIQQPEWYESSSGQAFSFSSFSALSHSFSQAASSSISTTRSGSSGGGFSGGGGGGGGGGSW